MDALTATIAQVHRSERDVGLMLLRAGERNRADHEMFHLCRDLAGWSRAHRRELARIGASRGLRLKDDLPQRIRLLQWLRLRAGTLAGRRQATALLLLLRDLRAVHLRAAAASIDWELLAQAAQAKKDQELLALATECHPQTLRQMRWANARLKESAPQAIGVPNT